jgi:predicted lipoprotein with Yx(FWY)xxD motif
MRRLLGPSALALLLVLAGCDDDDTATDATSALASSGAATVSIGETDLGPVLVDAEGFTLYLFLNDSDGTSSCTGGCADTWPPVISDAPSGGDGVDGGLLDTTARDDGSSQVTYNGHPLYRYAPDAAPGDTTGQGVGDVWYVVDASGNAVDDD